MMILNESKRDDLLLPYVEILNAKGIKCTSGVLKKWLLRHLTENGGLRNLSLSSNFYLAGAARYYFNGDLTTNKNLAVFDETNSTTDVWKTDVCERLNALILILRNSVIDSVGETFEQPEDFGELSLPKLLRKYGAKINKELGIEPTKKEKVVVDTTDRTPSVGNGYTFDILYSYDDARKYYGATHPGSWCITYGQNHFSSYVRRLGIHYVIFRKDGWENVKREIGPGWTTQKPQDEYGCSLIALLQSNTNGEPIYITSRWNHGSHVDNSHCNADHAFSKQEFMEKTGVTDADLQRIFEIWKKDKPKPTRGGVDMEVKTEKLRVLRCFKYAQMRINGGENPDNVLIKTTATDPVEASIQRDHSKMVLVGNGKPLKSIIAYKSNVAETPYFVLVDRGKILFDSITDQDNYHSYRWNKTFDYSDSTAENGQRISEFKWLRNAIVISLPNERYMVYDIRRKEYLNIGGTTKFKYLRTMSNTWSNIEPIFYEIKMSNNQIALVDINTNTPLMLPNGEYWFEDLEYKNKPNYWRREVKTYLVDKESGIIMIMYDSASSEFYLYDTNKKRFLDIDTSEFKGNIKISDLSEKGLENCFVIYNDTYIAGKRVARIVKDDKYVSIGGKTYFHNIRCWHNNYLYLTDLELERVATSSSDYNTTNIWSIEDEAFLLDENGKPLFTGTYPPTRSSSYNVLYIRREMMNYSGADDEISFYDPRRFVYSLYLPELKAMLINPTTNTDLFQIGKYGISDTGGKFKIYKDINDNEGTVLSYQELVDKKYYRTAVIPGSAKMELLGDEQTEPQMGVNDQINENLSITNKDIEKMVYEAINKIIKK